METSRLHMMFDLLICPVLQTDLFRRMRCNKLCSLRRIMRPHFLMATLLGFIKLFEASLEKVLLRFLVSS